MQKFWITIIAILTTLIGTSAFAADMAVKAPPPAPAPTYNWTGSYFGLNAGAGFADVKTDFSVAPVTLFGSALFPGFAGSNKEYPDGFIGGGQIGHNWQYSPRMVLGVEADFQDAIERDAKNLNTPFSYFIGPTTGTVATDHRTKIDWFGTVRGSYR